LCKLRSHKAGLLDQTKQFPNKSKRMKTAKQSSNLSDPVRIFQKEFIWADFYPDSKIFCLEWQAGSENISDELFKSYLLDFVQLFDLYQVKGFLVDSRKGHITMDEEIQRWHDQEIAPVYTHNNIEKIAFVMPLDIFAEVSISQAFDEATGSTLTTNYFDDLDLALAWIQE